MPPLSPAAPEQASQVDALNQRAYALRHTDARAALALCRQAHAMALRLDYQQGLAYSLLRMSLYQSILEGASAAPPATLQQAIQLMRSLGDQAGEAEALNHLGTLHLDRQEHAEAMACFQGSLALRQAVGHLASQAASLNNMALVLRNTGQLAEALEQLNLSLQLAEAAHDTWAAAYALANLGGVLAQVGEQPAAQAALDRALARARQTADRALECSILISLGRLASEAGQPAQALAHLSVAFDLAQGTGNLGDLAEALLSLGVVQQVLGDAAVSASLLDEALALSLRKGDPGLTAQVLLAQAGAPMAQGDRIGALAPLQQALAHAERARAEPLIARAHERLSSIHEALGDPAEALRHFRAFHASGQRLQQQSSQRRIRALVHQQEVARVHHDAQAERARNAELSHALAEARRAEHDRSELLAELQAQAGLLEQLAREDGLTGVANRRWLDLQLQREVERARRFHHPLAVAMVDIDHFKAVNDGFSHAVGDEALRTMARLLRDGCRASDVVGRYGGEEFVLVLVETPSAAAAALCDKLRRRIAAHDWTQLHPGLAMLTVSIGVAGIGPDETVDAVLARADRQLYLAKAEGRNRVRA